MSEDWLQVGYEFTHNGMVDYHWIPKASDPNAPKAKMRVSRITEQSVIYTYDWDERGIWKVPMPREEFIQTYGPTSP